MAEKIKKGFFKVLPLSVVIFLVASLVVTFTAPTPQNPVVSPILAAQNAVTDITMLDTNTNGEIDTIKVTVDNDAVSETAFIFSNTGWSVTDGGSPVTINGSVLFDTNADNVGDINTDNSDPLIIIVPLTEADVTQNDTLQTGVNLEVIYTQQGGINQGTEYKDSTNTQLVGIATGDTGAGDTEVDGAKPQIITKVYQDTGEDGTVETAVVTLTELVNFTEANLLTDFAFTANNLTGFAGNPTAIAGTGTSTVTFTVAATTDLTGVSGLTEPQIAFTDDTVNHLADAAGNFLASFAVTALVDDANPVRIGAITYSDNGTDGTVDRVTMGFTEKVTYTYADADWTAVANGLTGFDVTACTTCTNVTSVVLTATTTGSITGVGAGVRPTLEYTYVTQYISDASANNFSNFGGGVNLTDGAAPYLVSATYSDSNADGKVDRVAFLFTEVTTFTTVTAADWAFVAGDIGLAGDFAAAECAGSGTLSTITCTDAGTGTVDATADRTGKQTGGGSEPTFTYTNGTNDINDGLPGNNTATFGPITLVDGAAPRVVTRVTKDTDSVTGAAGTVDGTMDGILATFTEIMDASSAATGDFAMFLNNDTALTEAYSDTTDDTTLFFRATDITANDTSNLLKLQITGGDSIQDLSTVPNSVAAEGASSAATDGAAPYLRSATYSDSDADRKIDRVAFLFTEVTTWTTITAADWAFTTAGDISLVGDFAAAECAGSGTLATITCTDAGTGTVDATANMTGKQTAGGTEPIFTYTNNTNDINDTINNTGTFVKTLVDGAIPVRYGNITYSDNGTNGSVDRVTLVYTENVSYTYQDADWVATVNDIAGFDVTACTSCTNVTSLVLTATTTTGAITGVGAAETEPQLAYTAGNTITDTASNNAANIGATTLTDGAAPYLVSATYADSTGDGKVDRVSFLFTEETTLTTITAADWAFSAAGDVGLVGDFAAAECTASPAVTYVCTDAGTGTVDATASRTGKQTGGGSEPTFTYTNNTNNINDTVNNTATFGPLTLTDGAAAIIVTRVTKDTNSATGAAGTVDGDLDGVLATFTEVMDASSAAVTDFVVTLNDNTAKTESYSDTTDDTTLFFGLSNPTANDTADLLKLQITGGDGILDLAGVAAATEGAASAATDGAAPFLVSATYRDLTGTNGAVDTLRTTWSENVTLAHDNAVDWTIAAGSSINAAFSAATVDLVAGATLDITITADAGETSSAVAPTIAYDNDDANNSVVDGSTNVAGTMSAVTATDAAAPVVVTATFYDASPATNDGKLDRITVVWSENISAVADGSADWAISSAANFAGLAETAVICNSGAAAANECRYTFATTTVKTNVGDLTLTYTAGTSVTDGTNTAATKVLSSASSPAFTDAANPVVASTSPADGATSVALDASFSITFSEAMTTTDITTTTLGRSPTFTLGSVNGTWTSSDTVVTFASHDAWAGLQIYTIDLVQGSIKEAAAAGILTLDNTAIVADPYTFTTVGASGGGGGGGGGLPASVSVTTPNGGETLTGGGTYNVTWSAPGVADTINLYYSLDSGINFPNTIATALTNDGSYTWTVPNISSSTVKVKAVSGSLNDISDANLTITYTTPDVSLANSTVVASPTSVVADGTSFSTITVTVKDAAGVPLSGKVVTLASSRGATDTVTTVTGTTGADGKATFNVYSSTAGTSTYTVTAQGTVLSSTVSVVFTAVGEPTTPGVGETPTSISVGDLIKSPLSTSVYYYGSDNKRHLFPNEKTYKSWYVDFSNIKSVTASQLQGIALGHNVTVRPGTVLLKIDTDPKVYAVEPGGLLRWVPTEARALTLYGSAWASRIIDVPLVFWVDYSFGSDITTDQHPTGSLIQYTGTTDKYYIQGAERRLVSTAGFTANKFQLSNVLATPTTISYTLGTPITAEDTALTRIY